MLNEEVEVEADSEVIPISEINESELAWQDYLAGRDRGISSKELKLKLFGEKNDRVKVVEDEASNDYLQVQEWQVEHIKEGLRQADAGEFASDGEVAAALARWRE